DEAIARIKKNYPDVAVLRRPSNRPFATFGAHDPEGNYFDLTQEGMDNRRDVYAVRPDSPQVEPQREQIRRIHHIKLRVMNPMAHSSISRRLSREHPNPSKIVTSWQRFRFFSIPPVVQIE